MAIPVLQVLFTNRHNNHLNHFIEFLQQSPTVKSLNKDQWDLFLDFSSTVNEDLSEYDTSAAWPGLFDDYVEWRKVQISSADRCI
jgi:Cullin binding